MADRTKTSLYVDEDLLKQCKIKALEQGRTLTDVLEAALRAWLEVAPQSELEGLKASDRRWLERLIDHVKNQTDPVFIGIVRTMVDRMDVPADGKR